jgi:hypothetical protein
MANHFSGNIDRIKRLIIRRDDTGQELALKGRLAWCVATLIEVGPQGFTTIERPAPRTSDYIFQLRGKGLPIITEDEKHAGPYAGTHGRYKLNAPVSIVEAEFA